VRGLRKAYGTRVVVDDLDLDVPAGEIVGLIGANGAGKTTTVECIQGLRKPDAGRLSVLGLDPVTQAARLRPLVGSQLQESALPDRLRVAKAIELFRTPRARDGGYRPRRDQHARAGRVARRQLRGRPRWSRLAGAGPAAADRDGLMIRVLLVDDQELVRTGLRGILREPFGFAVVGECADGGEVVAAVEATAPDVVLMDVRMPFTDGVQATTRLRQRGDSPPVLALTTFDDDEALAGMLRAGASGFVLKGVPAEDLQRAVRAVAGGGAWLDPAVTSRVLAIYRSAPTAAAAGGDPELDALTARELEVLVLIGRGRTNGEIAADLFVSEGTVKTHVNHLFTKLRLRDRAAAVVFAYDHGLVSR